MLCLVFHVISTSSIFPKTFTSLCNVLGDRLPKLPSVMFHYYLSQSHSLVIFFFSSFYLLLLITCLLSLYDFSSFQFYPLRNFRICILRSQIIGCINSSSKEFLFIGRKKFRFFINDKDLSNFLGELISLFRALNVSNIWYSGCQKFLTYNFINFCHSLF